MKRKLGRFKVECLVYFEAHTTAPDVRRSEIHPSFLTLWTGITTRSPTDIVHTLTQAVSDDVIDTSQHVRATVARAANFLPCMCRRHTSRISSAQATVILLTSQHSRQFRITTVPNLRCMRDPPYNEHNSSSSAGTVGAGWSGVRNPVEARDNSPNNPDRLWCPPNGTGSSFPRGKAPRVWSCNLRLLAVKVTNSGTVPYVHGVARGNFRSYVLLLGSVNAENT